MPAVSQNRTQPGIELTYTEQAGDTAAIADGGDQYTGLDRFGRVIDQNWITTSTGASTDRFQYAYDRDGNVLYKDNLVISSLSELFHANSTASGDNNTAYDGLSRLVAFTRGTLSVDSSHHNGTSGLGSLDKVTTASSLSDHSDTYTLSAVGDQTSTTQDGTGTTNTINSQNELTANGSNTLVYDNNGNTTTDQAGNTYIYDAWNHAVTVKNSGGTTIAAYAYDADGRRISQTESGTTTSFYLDPANGNVIEERQSSTVVAQEIWGAAYTNELILRDDNSTSGSLGKSGSGLGRRLYYQYDANFNLTAVISVSGSVLQRIVYDPNGNVKFLTSSGTATTDGYATAYGFQGGRRDALTGFVFFNATGSGRDYNPVTGTWIEPDNAGYINGVNYYQMEGRNLIARLDPRGLSSVSVDEFAYQPATPAPGKNPTSDRRSDCPAVPGKSGGEAPKSARKTIEDERKSIKDLRALYVRDMTAIDGDDSLSTERRMQDQAMIGAIDHAIRSMQEALETGTVPPLVMLGGSSSAVNPQGTTESQQYNIFMTAAGLSASGTGTKEQSTLAMGLEMLPFATTEMFAAEAEYGVFSAGVGCFRKGTKVLRSAGVLPIERMSIGNRVLTGVHDDTASSIIPEDYRVIRLQFAKEGQEFHMSFLRQAKRFEGVGAGDFVELSVLELEIQGRARVLAIEPCPPIEEGTGRIVTGVFNSQSVDVRRLTLQGLNDPIEVTGNHPVFSEDRGEFVVVSKLHGSERLRTRDGVAVVSSVTACTGKWDVFNMEIEGAHQYYISEQQVLVHNVNGFLAPATITKVQFQELQQMESQAETLLENLLGQGSTRTNAGDLEHARTIVQGIRRLLDSIRFPSN